jgi:hypothetical protein
MLEACLNNKIIRDFLKNYKQSQWQKLIPSLIEIAILNLNSSFHTLIFSEADITNILDDLKFNQNINNTNSNNINNISNNISNKKNFYNEKNSHIIFSKPSDKWRTADGGIPPLQGMKKNANFENEIFFENTRVTNNSKYSKDNKDLNKENILNKRIIKNTKSKIKEQIENERRKYYDKINEFYGKNNNIKPIEKKINYAISYDKNLEPEMIEKTTINKNRKGGKIVEKMTQEEFEQKFPDEEENPGNEYEEEEGNEEEYYQDNNNNFKNNDNVHIKVEKNINNNIKDNNDKINRRKNLYHYKTDNNNNNSNMDNNIIMNNINQEKKLIMPNSIQQSFNPKNFKNQQQNIAVNNDKNKYINIENNNSNKPKDININEEYDDYYNQNQNSDFQYNNNSKNNYKLGISESEEKSSKFIGIEKKYQKKIDELEQNIMNNNNNINQNINNIDNYGDKVKVNITNMEEYSKGLNQNNNIVNEEEEENEMEENEADGVLSQMSNMSDRTKSLFKRTMDEYPPLDEDTLYEQSQNK